MKEPIAWQDFEKVDMHIGTIIEVDDFPEAKNPAYKVTVDFGKEIGKKKSSAQITKLYKKEDLLGKQVICVVNFPPKQIANFFSECLIMGVVGKEKEITLLQPERKVENGLRIG
ncbi:tRNA-binding protein [Candidatus Woesearchaeota archaeon]|nr:tRNA-binding protein [Candidatus Woesearchaeota archaeon]